MRLRGVKAGVWVVGAAAILVLAAASGCADDNDPLPPAPPTSNIYQGGWADNGNAVGGLNFTFLSALVQTADTILGGSAIEATGQVHVNGGSNVALSGSYNPDTFTITLAQANKGTTAYSLTGVLQGGEFHGTIITPTGNGGFAAVPVSSVTADTIYCGAYNCDSGCPGGGGGFFDTILFGSAVVLGVRSFVDSETLPLAGTVSGNTITVDDQGVTAAGTVSGSSVGGTYAGPAEFESGTWAGSTDCFGGRRR